MKNTKSLIVLFFALAAPMSSLAFASNPSLPASRNITTVYTNSNDLAQKSFTVQTGQKVRFEVNPTDTGSGCMKEIMIPGLWNKPEPLVKGKKIVMEFTPNRPGAYKITCAMGVPRGVINVR